MRPYVVLSISLSLCLLATPVLSSAAPAKNVVVKACKSGEVKQGTKCVKAKAKAKAANCNVKGNISSSGEKIFHVPGCASYNATIIDTTAGERVFCTEKEALDAGWRKAKNCGK